MITRTEPVASIVLDHPETAVVLQQYRIDFCCQGQRTLTEACDQRGLDVDAVVGALEASVRSAAETRQGDPRSLPIEQLTDHIVRRYHSGLREELPFLQMLAAKVARVHGAHEPHLVELGEAVERLVETIEPHLDHEEQVLFPALSAVPVQRALVEQEMAVMHEEHLVVGRLLDQLRTLTDGYVAPSHACNSYRTLFAELARLETDTLRHVHLENHVLIPRVAETL